MSEVVHDQDSLPPVAPPGREYTPPWRDFLGYLTLRRWLILVYAVAAVELGARAFVALLPPSLAGFKKAVTGQSRSEQLMQADAYLGHRLRPGVELHYRTEGVPIDVRTTDFGLGDIGFRDLGMKPPFDIIALGDSFTYCDDISAAGCWLTLLGKQSGRSVGNLGVPGYSTTAQTRLLERYGPALKPRVVLLTVFANDFRDNQQFDRWLKSGSDDFPQWLGRQRRKGAIGQTLARYSQVFRIFLATRRVGSRQMQNHKDGKLDLSFSFDPWWIDLVKNVERHPGLALMEQSLLGAQAEAKKLGSTLVVMLLPSKEEVYWDIAKQYAQLDLDVDHPRRVVRRFLEAQGIKLCDVTDGLRRAAARHEQLYLRVSGHWTAAGHAVVADLTAKCLAEQGLLPPADQRPGGAGSPPDA